MACTRGVLAFLAFLAFLACADGGDGTESYPHAGEPVGSVREIYDGALTPALAVTTFRNTERLFPTRRVAVGAAPRALPPAATPLGKVWIPVDGDSLPLDSVLVLNRVTGMLVLRDGAVLLERYAAGNTPRTRWMSMSIAKSVVGLLVGAALRDGHLHSLDTAVTALVPSLRGSAWEGVTLRHAIAMRSGVGWSEAYTNPGSDRRRLLDAQLAGRRGAMLAVLRALPRAAPPDRVTVYSTGETQVVAEALRAAVGQSLSAYLSARIWRPAGMEHAAEWWLDAPDGIEIGGSGLSATLRDYGRLGLFVLDRGVVRGDSLLPGWWVDSIGAPQSQVEGADYPYGWLWWPLTGGLAGAHRAFNAEGIHGQFLVIDPTARMVIVQWAARPEQQGGERVDDYAVFNAIIRAAMP